jgi:hypothetical protein
MKSAMVVGGAIAPVGKGAPIPMVFLFFTGTLLDRRFQILPPGFSHVVRQQLTAYRVGLSRPLGWAALC